MNLWVTVLKPFGFYDDHCVGENFRMPLEYVNVLVRKGLVEIVVNNMGNNNPSDEIEEVPFVDVVFPKACHDEE